MMGFGLLLPIVLLLIVAFALGWLPDLRQSADRRTRGAADAEEILRKRYARGEIDRAEFKRMREDLRA